MRLVDEYPARRERAGKKQPPIKLLWLERVRDELTEDRPANHVSILALATVLQMHANRVGESIYPGQATMGREAGIRHAATVRNALDWLVKTGLLAHVRNRARGLREYSLTFPGEAHQIANEYPSDDEPSMSTSDTVAGSDSHSDSHSPGHSLTTNPVTPVPPSTTHRRESEVSECSDCGMVHGSASDCAEVAPFVSSPIQAAEDQLTEAGFDFREAAS